MYLCVYMCARMCVGCVRARVCALSQLALSSCISFNFFSSSNWTHLYMQVVSKYVREGDADKVHLDMRMSVVKPLLPVWVSA